MEREENERMRGPSRGAFGWRLAGIFALAVALLLAPIVVGRDPLTSLIVLLGLAAGGGAVFAIRALLSRDALLLFQCMVDFLGIGTAILMVWPSLAPLSGERIGLSAAGFVLAVAALADAWRCGVLTPLDAERGGLGRKEWIVPWVRSRSGG